MKHVEERAIGRRVVGDVDESRGGIDRRCAVSLFSILQQRRHAESPEQLTGIARAKCGVGIVVSRYDELLAR